MEEEEELKYKTSRAATKPPATQYSGEKRKSLCKIKEDRGIYER